MDHLNRLTIDEGRFREEFEVLGTHLQNARKKYEDAQRRLDRFEDKLLTTADIGEQSAELPVRRAQRSRLEETAPEKTRTQSRSCVSPAE